VAHYLSWAPHTTVVVRFEELKDNTVAVLQRMLAVLRVSVSDEVLGLAVERSSFQKMKAVETQSGIPDPWRFRPEFQFVRKGVSRQWLDYFSDEDLAFYQKVRSEYGFDHYD
jgi:hypothetical protein